MRYTVRELARTFRSMPVLLAILLVLIGGFLAPDVSPGLGSLTLVPTTAPSAAVSVDYLSGEYTFSVVVSSYDGAAFSGARVVVSIQNGTSSIPAELAGTTNSSGLLSLRWPAPECVCETEFEIRAGGTPILESAVLPSPAPSSLTPLTNPFFLVFPGTFVARQGLELAFASGDGSVPSGTALEYCVTSAAEPMPTCTTLAQVTHGPQSFLFDHVKIPFNGADEVEVILVNSSGYTLAQAFYSGAQLDPTIVYETPAGLSMEGAVWFLSFIAALSAFLIGFLVYGRDRLDGSLESVLALPITRRRLLLTRYTSSLVAVFTSALVGTAAVGLDFAARFAVTLPLNLWLALMAGLTVEGLIFAGLSFLGAHITRSASVLLVAGVLVSLVVTILWVPLLGSTLAQAPQLAALPIWELLNPAQPGIDVNGRVLLGIDGAPLPFVPAGPSWAVLIGASVAWVLAPIAGAGLIFRFRD